MTVLTPTPHPAGEVPRPVLLEVLRAVARALLTLLVALLVLASAPTVLGWQAHAVVTGSMEPAIAAGDVVVTAPVTDGPPPVGSVVAFHDPTGQGRVVVHRVTGVDAGRLVTRGDANQSTDPATVPAEDVIGTARLRVPAVALPLVWARDGDVLRLAAVVGALAVMLLAAGPASRGPGRGAGRGADPTTTVRSVPGAAA